MAMVEGTRANNNNFTTLIRISYEALVSDHIRVRTTPHKIPEFSSKRQRERMSEIHL